MFRRAQVFFGRQTAHEAVQVRTEQAHHNNAMSAASSFDLPSPTDGADMSLSDLEGPPARRAHAPTRSSRFTLLAQRDEHDDSNEADESYIDEEQLEEEPPANDLGDSQHIEADGSDVPPQEDVADDLDALDEVVETTPKAPNRSVIPESEIPHQRLVESSSAHPISEDDRLRQQLFDMQRLNEAFSSYHFAVHAVREKQKVWSTYATGELLSVD